jgi:chromosome segregation ATPase
LAEIKRRIQVATSTISTLEEQIKTVSTQTTVTTTTITEQVTRIKVLIVQQETIIKTETAEQTKTEKALEELMTSWKKTMTQTTKLKRDLKRSQESYEDSQRRLRKEVDVKTKIDEYRAKVATTKKTLEQKFTQITKIMIQIKEEVESHKKRAGQLTEQVEECTKRTTIARTTITTLTSKQNTLEGSSKTLKGGDLSKVKAALDKLGDELENAKNQL